MQIDTITKILNIPNHKVKKIIQNTSDCLELMLEPVEDEMPRCSDCSRVHHTAVHSRGHIVIEDLPISGRRVFLHVCTRMSKEGAVWEDKKVSWASIS